MSKKLKVEYHSQQHESVPVEWQLKSCGATCVKMLLNFHGRNHVKLLDLINEGNLIGGFKDGLWQHEILVRLLRNHGLNAYNEEFRSIKVSINENNEALYSESEFEPLLIQNGIKKIAQAIENGNPVIVSVNPGFGASEQSHLVVVTGYEGKLQEPEGFYINDPDSRHQEFENRFVSVVDFKKYWRKFAIFSY